LAGQRRAFGLQNFGGERGGDDDDAVIVFFPALLT
jgi:hypothetical protein